MFPDVRLSPRRPVLLSALLLLAALVPPTGQGVGHFDARATAERAVVWLRSQQGPDGDVLATEWVVLAAAAVDQDPSRWTSSKGATPSDWLAAHPPDDLSAIALEKRILALVALYEDPRDFRGRDHVASLLRLHLLGQIGDLKMIADDYFGIFALVAAGVDPSHPAVQDAATTLLDAQEEDGSWGSSGTPNVDETAASLAALHLAGRDLPDVQEEAFAYLKASQRPDGSFRSPNLSPLYSTSWVLWSLATTGDPLGLGGDARAWLAAQVGDQGCIANAAGCDAWATWQAAHALSGTPMPPRRTWSGTTIVIPATGDRATSVAMRAAGPDADLWRWDFGDGAHGSGRSASHRYGALGRFDVLVYADAADRRSARAEGHIEIRNLPPTVSVTLPEGAHHAGASLPVAVRASDPDGPPPLVSLDFGDGAVVPGAGKTTFSHSYAQPGVYRIVAVAADADGAAATGEGELTILNRPPVVQLDLPVETTRIEDVLLMGSGQDPDGDPVTFRWTFEDGAQREGAAVVHRFSQLGASRVRFEARDPHGGTASIEGNVTVVNLPPIVQEARVPLEVPAGHSLVLVATAIDPDGPVPSAEWSIDGSPWDGSVPAPGIHVVLLRVVDLEGSVVERRWNVTVLPPPAGVNASAEGASPQSLPTTDAGTLTVLPSAVRTGEPVVLRLEGAWEGTVRIEFGDGTRGAFDVSSFPITHAYLSPGSYVIQASGGTSAGALLHQLRVEVANRAPFLSIEGTYLKGNQTWVWGRAGDEDGLPVEVVAWTSEGPIEVMGTSRWEGKVPLDRTPLTLRARARDDAGQWSGQVEMDLALPESGSDDVSFSTAASGAPARPDPEDALAANDSTPVGAARREVPGVSWPLLVGALLLIAHAMVGRRQGAKR